MLKNYPKSAFRNLWKNRTYSILNIIGLSIGVTAAAFIFGWVEDARILTLEIFALYSV